MFATTSRFGVWLALLLPAVWHGSPAAAVEGPPAFAIRGTLPWHNFLSGPTAWNEGDYRAYLDDLAARGLNFVGFHCYTGGAERYAPYVEHDVFTGIWSLVVSSCLNPGMGATGHTGGLAIARRAGGRPVGRVPTELGGDLPRLVAALGPAGLWLVD